ncbi:MAG TPA: DUF6807 family protein [Thermoguttaceae bacterium]|nr:DUF6807 family protein [Thermoguttaceae bacterium]
MQSSRIMFATALCILLLAVFVIPAYSSAEDKAEAKFTLVPDEYGMVLKLPDGRTMFRYMTKKPKETNLTANSVCCLYPVYTPSGERAVDFAPGDHRHHRGIFLAWHAMEGDKRADFWGWGQFAPTENRVIENRSVKLLAADATSARIEVRNDWVAEKEVMLEELLRIAARVQGDAYVIDLCFRFTPAVDVTLDQTAFGGLCVKGRQEGTAVYSNPQGPVDLPNPHHLKPETDWPAADWYDYTVKLDDGTAFGVAVLDHPRNPPSTWHNLEPIAMVNPCIVAPGPVKLEKGKPLKLCYRLVIHDGPTPAELLEKLTAEWRK